MKRNRRLVTSLTRSYVFFGLTIGLINGLLGYFMQDWLTVGRASELTAGALVRPDYEQIPVEKVEAAGGRIEILDDHLRVVYTRGIAGGQEAYTSEQLVRLLEDRKTREYQHSLASFQTESGQSYSLLVMMPIKGNYAQVYINFVLLLLFALSVFIYSRWMARRITGPLEKIVTAIRRMRDGHYNERLSYKSDYELTQIQEHFNEMGTNLERTELEKKELELGKQRMILNLSHDLKTPLTTIQGYAKALQLGMVDSPEKQRRYLEIIDQKSNVVVALIEDMFQLATLESLEYPFVAEVGDIAELLRHIAIEFYDQFERKGIVITVQIPEEKITILMDRKLMHRAVSNLLSNALQHNEEGTEVTLILEEPDSASVRIQVCDDGASIPEELKDTLFQPFVKADQARTSGGGTGLGLAIAHQAIELHGGTLRLLEETRRKVFEIRLSKPIAAG
ncbi:HAMP domain-containing sensor histidine kinase [Gorillibacterium massiliense]|uniref:HAMP domain-containing sensor histidine kinase n=1 Tax=Gorillibacterium massiliense TaxID=1280390 RepID=UPI0004B39F05|nr:HAMP domain-containing sensor histidine kinase [Gorillibacterium massiliense]